MADRTPRRKRSWLRALCVFLVLVAGGVGAFVRYRTVPMKLIPAGCEVIHADGLCELRDPRDKAVTQTVRVWVDAPQGARLFAFADSLPTHIVSGQPVAGGQVVEVETPAGTERVTVFCFHDLHLYRSTLRTSAPLSAPWLLEARRLWHDNHLDEALEILRKNRAETPRDRALSASLQANIQMDRSNFAEAERLLRQALAEDRTTDLPSLDLDDAMTLSSLLGQNLRRFVEAEEMLEDRKALFERMPHRKALRALQLGLFRHMRGDHAGAMKWIEDGLRDAAQFGDRFVSAELQKLKAQVLESLGRTNDSLAVLDNVDLDDFDKLPPCRQANLLDERGSLRLFALESSPDLRVAENQFDPRSYFKQALQVRERCNDATAIASDWTGLARAELLLGQVNEAERLLRRAQAAVKDPDASLRVEWADVEGRIQLARQQWVAAEKTYRGLLQLAQAEPRDIDDPYGSRWRAWVGIGQAREKDHPEEAIEAYQQAETYLDERGLKMPLNDGRGGFLGRHEYGTALYIDLLVRRGRNAEALLAVRHARVRALLTFTNLARIASWSDAQREVSRKKLDEYTSVRNELEKLETSREDTDERELAALSERAGQLRAKLHLLADEALQLGTDIASVRFNPPEAGEVLLTCHTARNGWLCFAQAGARVEAVALPRLDDASFGVLLNHIAPLLDGAKRLRVLAFGASRKFDLEALPFRGRPLGETFGVRYAVDLAGAPWSEPAAGAKSGALMVIDPDNNIPDSTMVVDEVSPLLGERFDVHVVRGRYGTVNHAAGEPATKVLGLDDPQWLTRLTAADLFLYYGHGGKDAAGGPALKVDNVGLNTSDILTLPRVPPRTLLIACRGGLSDEETGGLERVGVAQAFLLRGSHWVIAPVRDVDVIVGAELAIALIRAGIDRPDADPVAALREARRKTRDKLAASVAEKKSIVTDSLDAFRVFVL